MLTRYIKAAMTVMLAFAMSSSYGQTTAMDFNRTDCNGNPANLYADLDAGKAVILFYYMPNCSSCPPPAQAIQMMANNINTTYPGTVKGYAFSFSDLTPCSVTQAWVTDNTLPLYAPMDSGAASIAHYGGFGMPTVVLVGGSDHRVLFSSLSFNYDTDTTILRDSILALLGVTGIDTRPGNASNLSIYPNPAGHTVTLTFDLAEQTDLVIDIADITGKQVAVISKDKKAAGNIRRTFNTDALVSGLYTIRINAGGKALSRKLEVLH
jgi:hypothetical protein